MKVYLTQPWTHLVWNLDSGKFDVKTIGLVDLSQYKHKNGLAVDDTALIQALVEHHAFLPSGVTEDGDPNVQFSVLNVTLLTNDGRINKELSALNGYTFVVSKGHKAVFYRKNNK